MKRCFHVLILSFLLLMIPIHTLLSSGVINSAHVTQHSSSVVRSDVSNFQDTLEPVNDQSVRTQYNRIHSSKSTSKKSFKTAEHESITIESNDDFIKQANNEGWSGDGKKATPYIIEGYNITGTNNLIKISNTDLYFHISNCHLNGEGSNNGIAFRNVSNGCITNNTIFDAEVGIQIASFSKRNTISKNLISNNSLYGIKMDGESELNIIKLNDFTESNVFGSLAIDNGYYNIFAFNFWDEWFQPDKNNDGIIDVPYLISGSAKNNDTFPLSNPNPPQEHFLSTPIVINPVRGENFKGKMLIQWTDAIDSFEHEVLYSVHISRDKRIWKCLIDDLQTTSYLFDTMLMDDGFNYWISIHASCSETGMTEISFYGPFSIQNIFTPFFRFVSALIIIMIAAVLLIGAILWRKRVRSRKQSILNQVDIQKLTLGLCFGSFTDEGLIIQGKNDSCPFDDQQLQSMLEYSAVLYQYGEAGTIYGPFPLSSLKEFVTLEESPTKWNFVSFWLKITDDSIKDVRIARHGKVPAALLLFFPTQFDTLIMLQKSSICDIFEAVLEDISQVSDITSDILNQIEVRLFSLLSS